MTLPVVGDDVSGYLAAMSELMSQAVRDVVVVAAREARLAGRGFIGVEHLLVGVLRVERALAAQALESRGITADRACARLVQLADSREQQTSASSGIFDETSRKVLLRALRAARALGCDQIGIEHLLLALHHDESRFTVVGGWPGFEESSTGVRAEVLDMMFERGRVQADARNATGETCDVDAAGPLQLRVEADTVVDDDVDVATDPAARIHQAVRQAMLRLRSREIDLATDSASGIRRGICRALMYAHARQGK